MNVCRVCLSAKPEKDISQLKLDKNEGNESPSEIVQFCLGIKVNEDSSITKKFCSICLKKIRTFYKFKAMAHRNDATLRSLGSEEVRVKLEPIQVESEDLVKINEDQEFLCDVKQESDAPDYNYSDDEFLSSLKILKSEESSEDTESVTVQSYPKAGNDKSTAEKEDLKNANTDINSEPLTRLRKIKRKKIYGIISGICDQCGKTVKDIKQHALVHLPKSMRKQYPCKDPDCREIFITRGARCKHHKRKHLRIKQHCDICNKDYVYLPAHIKQVHEPHRLPYPCVMCDRRFITNAVLEEHLNMHTKHHPYTCEHCGQTFRQAVIMRHHIRAVHLKEKSHMCQYCSKKFFKKDHLKRHITSHTKEKLYQCKECGRSFSTSGILKKHMITHKTTKDIHCTQCSMSFTCKDYLRAHMLSHSKIKKHPCKYCGVTFSRSDHRNRHEFTAHQKNMRVGANGGNVGGKSKMAADQSMHVGRKGRNVGGKNKIAADQNIIAGPDGWNLGSKNGEKGKELPDIDLLHHDG